VQLKGRHARGNERLVLIFGPVHLNLFFAWKLLGRRLDVRRWQKVTASKWTPASLFFLESKQSCDAPKYEADTDRCSKKHPASAVSMLREGVKDDLRAHATKGECEGEHQVDARRKAARILLFRLP
jgi:hypothetical protein